MALYSELDASNPEWKKIYDDYAAFRRDANLWFRFTEAGFDDFMQAQKLRARRPAAGHKKKPARAALFLRGRFSGVRPQGFCGDLSRSIESVSAFIGSSSASFGRRAGRRARCPRLSSDRSRPRPASAGTPWHLLQRLVDVDLLGLVQAARDELAGRR